MAISALVRPTRILVTGYTGFVGRYLIAACRREFPDAQLFDLSRKHLTAQSLATTPDLLELPDLPDTTSDYQNPSTRHVSKELVQLQADMTEQEQVRQAVAVAQPDLVFHLAAQPSVARSWVEPVETLQINALGAVHLFESLRAERLLPRVVLVGSAEEYGLVRVEENPISEDCLLRPVNPYAVSKAVQDIYGSQYFVSFGLPILRVRPFNHFGPAQGEVFVIANFARQIALIEHGRPPPVISVGNLDAQRDFLPVQDVISAYIAVAK